MAYVKLVGNKSPDTNWTTEYVLEKDENGDPTLVVQAGVPVDLSAEQQKMLEDNHGLIFEKSSKAEAEHYSETPSDALAGADVAGSAPVLGDGGSLNPNQQKSNPDKK